MISSDMVARLDRGEQVGCDEADVAELRSLGFVCKEFEDREAGSGQLNGPNYWLVVNPFFLKNYSSLGWS